MSMVGGFRSRFGASGDFLDCSVIEGAAVCVLELDAFCPGGNWGMNAGH
jgi:hypothetical protein